MKDGIWATRNKVNFFQRESIPANGCGQGTEATAAATAEGAHLRCSVTGEGEGEGKRQGGRIRQQSDPTGRNEPDLRAKGKSGW